MNANNGTIFDIMSNKIYIWYVRQSIVGFDPDSNQFIFIGFFSAYSNAGLQAQVWTEVMRTERELHEMIFPRIIAVAERAWHEALWEKTKNRQERIHQTDREWATFVEALRRELKRLDDIGIMYRVPPPGVRYLMFLIDVFKCTMQFRTYYKNVYFHSGTKRVLSWVFFMWILDSIWQSNAMICVSSDSPCKYSILVTFTFKHNMYSKLYDPPTSVTRFTVQPDVSRNSHWTMFF